MDRELLDSILRGIDELREEFDVNDPLIDELELQMRVLKGVEDAKARHPSNTQL